MRNPSFTKRGPGRRPAHVNKALAAVWDKLVAAQIKAQKRKAQKKMGVVCTAIKCAVGTVTVDVFHNDILSKRGDRLYVGGDRAY